MEEVNIEEGVSAVILGKEFEGVRSLKGACVPSLRMLAILT